MVTKRDPKGWHARGYLPHFDSPEQLQHIVFRTHGSLPLSLLDALPQDATQRLREIDALLDKGLGPSPLSDPAVASIVAAALRHFDAVRYRLTAWCVMPNHVHALMETLPGFRLGDIVKSWKTFSAQEINRSCGSVGPFWARDYFDRFMRNETDVATTAHYIEQNPVAAGLVARASEWRWSSAWGRGE